jgi:hypothetical protein
MKIAKDSVESKGLSFNEAIFMRGGEPKDHGICAQNDKRRARNDRANRFFNTFFGAGTGVRRGGAGLSHEGGQ